MFFFFIIDPEANIAVVRHAKINVTIQQKDNPAFREGQFLEVGTWAFAVLTVGEGNLLRLSGRFSCCSWECWRSNQGNDAI